jgi:AcrR family transcriptional regulator
LRRRNSRNDILDAAEAVVRKSGAVHLTLDAVAEKAGLSKGGLLYNFPSKETLLEAMVGRQLERFENDRAAARKRLKDRPGADLEAHVRSGVDDAKKNQQLCSAMLAAVANNPVLLTPVRRFHRNNLKLLNDADIGFERAAILWLATDGLWLLEMLQVSPLSIAQRKRITDTMLKLVEKWS